MLSLMTVSITLRIFRNNATLTENQEWLSTSFATQILTSQNRAYDGRKTVYKWIDEISYIWAAENDTKIWLINAVMHTT